MQYAWKVCRVRVTRRLDGPCGIFKNVVVALHLFMFVYLIMEVSFSITVAELFLTILPLTLSAFLQFTRRGYNSFSKNQQHTGYKEAQRYTLHFNYTILHKKYDKHGRDVG